MELDIFFEIKELQYLGLLSSCHLLEFPKFLEAQNELQTLDLSNNKIEGKIPKWFWNIGKETLGYLNLSFNLLSKFEHPPVVLP